MFGDELPGSMPLTFFADRRHVVVKTANGQLVNIAALTLWTTRWGVQRVHDIVTKLNAEVSARRIATTAS